MLETTLKEVAHTLRVRKDSGKQTVLFLGARAGGFFGNSTLYDYIKVSRNALSSFDDLNDIQKFHDCYDALKSFNESNLHDILTASLKDELSIRYREEDTCLAELVKERYFSIIISTNIDEIIEDTFLHEEMRDIYDYKALIVGLHANEDIVNHQFNCCVILKVLGDLGSRKYTIKDGFALSKNKVIRDFLETYLDRSVLVIGFDPIWDQSVERVFPAPVQKGDIVYINEELPVKGSYIADVIEQRGGRCLVGVQGGYTKFMKELHMHLLKRRPFSFDSIRKMTAQLQRIEIQLSVLQTDITDLRADVKELKMQLEVQGEN